MMPPKPPPILRNIFPQSAAAVHLSPTQAVAWLEMLVKHINASSKLPLRATITKRDPLKLTIEVSVAAPALEAAPEENP